MLCSELIALGKYLAGEFANQEQALAEPAWYVHLHLWLRPVPLFREDSITLFAEQANIVKLEQPYRPRLIRLKQEKNENTPSLKVQHYMFEDIEAVRGAGSDRTLLAKIDSSQISYLPDCDLQIAIAKQHGERYHFRASPASEQPCNFSYQGKKYQVALGFEVNQNELITYDKGIDPQTGKAIWGALMGGYRYQKYRDFASEIQLF